MLAWRENLTDQRISEISYTVNVGTNRTTTWDVNCLDNSGKPVKKIHVNYPETLLDQGSRFYRDVFDQICSSGKWSALTNLNAGELNQRFWDGADLNGMAREEGIHAAFKIIGTKPSISEAIYAPELAGLLSQIPMPSLCGGLTIDATLLARGSAWLAMSESMLADRSSASDENWAPILFMAGRENTACALWKAKISAEQAKQNDHTLFQWWNFFLQRPKARAAFEFVADSKQRRFGMPMMTYYSRLEYLGTPLVELLSPMYGRSPTSLRKLYNYGGFLQASTDVGGGRILEGAWPAIFREEWRKTLNDLPASPNDYTGYAGKLKNIHPATALERDVQDDLSLTGLKKFAPLLQLGYEQGVGKLIPTATVTARDLLNYGWEMNGLQMGSRYYYVQQVWGIPDLARTIFSAGTHDIEGQMPFFRNDFQNQVSNLQESHFRLQMVDDLAWRSVLDIQPFAKDITDTNGARLFAKRCWLRPYEVRWQAYSLARSGLCDEMIRLLQRYHSNCGLKSDVISVEYLQDWSDKEIDAQPGLRDLKEQIVEGMVEPCGLQISALYRKKYATLGNAERAKAYESIFWQNPDSNLEQDILNGYITGGAWKSAKRFYTQARDVLSRDVGFSNWLTPQIWMLGFLTKDEDLMQLALEDSNTGSYAAMMTAVWHYTSHDELEKAERQLTELIDRYEPEQGPQSQGRMMKAFIPMIHALKDTKDPQHEVALDYLGKSQNGVILRWILIQKLKLSNEEAIRLLGGKETDRLRRLMVLYLQNENEDLLKNAFLDYLGSHRQQRWGTSHSQLGCGTAAKTSLNIQTGRPETARRQIHISSSFREIENAITVL